MRPTLAAVLPAMLLVAGTVTTTGCQRSGEDPAAASAGAPAGAAPPADAPAAAPPPAAAAPTDAAPEADVLLAYVWQCDGGLTLRMKNLLRDGAVTVELHEGARKLPQVESASGAKYSDGSITFWNKGEAATWERAGTAPVDCRLDRYQSLLADARERGVVYRGTGNEPGWHAEIGGDGHLLFVTQYGQERHEFAASQLTESAEHGIRIYQADLDQQRLRITVSKEPCTDDMSGQAFDHRMVVKHRGQTYNGCATDLR